jgi:hypothetical protein
VRALLVQRRREDGRAQAAGTATFGPDIRDAAVTSFSWGHLDCSLVLPVEQPAIPRLLQAAARGELFERVTIRLPGFALDLIGVMIVSFQTTSGGDTAALTLNFDQHESRS